MTGGPHDVPTVAEMIDAVAGWLEGEPSSGTVHPFHARVAANMLRIVGRELELGPEQAARHAARLAALGVASDRELADRIRAGELAGPDVRDIVWESVRDKLAVANPGHLDRVEPRDR